MTAKTPKVIAGVVGDPIAHSLSPVIQNAWIEAVGLDAVYLALRCPAARFAALAQRLRGGEFRGLNVTAPLKSLALAAADRSSERAHRAGAANLLLFEADGAIVADNTDGEGLMAAFAEQAAGFDPMRGPAVILGAGGAARGAAAAFLEAGAPQVRLVNRSADKARALAAELGEGALAIPDTRLEAALHGAAAIINATPASPVVPLRAAAPDTVVMDMVYRPLMTPLLIEARRQGLPTVDGLAMLIGQARPSFRALFGAEPPLLDVRGVALEALES